MKLYYSAIFLKEDDEDNEEIPRAHFENIDIKETVVKIELNLTGLDDNKKE